MKFNGSDSLSQRWALILAGGDGKRLLPLTRRIAGDDRPKQFCAVLGNETLLHQTQRRVSQLVQPQRTLLVLTRTHEPFYADKVVGIPPSRLLIQPSNQGTAPAILYSLLCLCEMDPKSVVAFFPSDHHFSDDEAFIGYIDAAYAAAASRPEVVILLGIPPETPEPEYGWIEPGAAATASYRGHESAQSPMVSSRTETIHWTRGVDARRIPALRRTFTIFVSKAREWCTWET